MWGIELIETATNVGGVTLNSGSIVLTTDGTDTIGAITVEPQDIFYLDVTQTTMVGGTSVATATMLLDGSDVYLDSGDEEINALTLQSPDNAAPVLDNLGAMQLTTIGQNSLNTSGDLVSAIILSAGGDRITDANTGAVEGLAITAVDNTNGSWQYSTDGGASWAGFGAVSDSSAVVLGDSANDRIRFVPDVDYTGSATITFRAWDTTDGNPSGTNGVDTTSNGGSTAFSAATETANITVEPTEVLLWLSSTDDVGPDYSQPGSGVSGLESWSEGEIIGVSDPNLSFGSGTTNGTFSSIVNFDLFAADSDVDITAMHHVIADITLTGPGILSGSIDLLAGDVIFVTDTAETLNNAAAGAPAGWANNIVTAAGDIYVFRAENTANYSSGYFRLLMTDPSVTQTTAITLVEKATTVGGDAALAAGDFLFVDSLQKNDIRWYDTATNTSVSLVSGVDIGISDAIYGLELAEVSSSVAGVVLDIGDILVTLDKADAAVGNNNLSVKEHDVVALKFTATTFGSGTAAATASLLFDGDGNANFDANKENLDALTLIFRGTGVNQAPVITLSGAPAVFVENGSPVIIDGSITVTDIDSPDFAGGTPQRGDHRGRCCWRPAVDFSPGKRRRANRCRRRRYHLQLWCGCGHHWQLQRRPEQRQPAGGEPERQCGIDLDPGIDAQPHLLEHLGQPGNGGKNHRFRDDRRRRWHQQHDYPNSYRHSRGRCASRSE